MPTRHIASSLLAIALASCDGSSSVPTECTGIQADIERPVGPHDLEWFDIVRVHVENDEPPARCPEIRDAWFKWIRGHYADSIVGVADIEETIPCGCGGEGDVVRLRWRWRVPEAADGEDRMEAYLTSTVNGGGLIEVWPARIALPVGTTCSSAEHPPVDAAEHPIAIRLDAASIRVPAWGIETDEDLQAVVASERPSRPAPEFLYDNVCARAEPGISPPVFGVEWDDEAP